MLRTFSISRMLHWLRIIIISSLSVAHKLLRAKSPIIHSYHSSSKCYSSNRRRVWHRECWEVTISNNFNSKCLRMPLCTSNMESIMVQYRHRAFSNNNRRWDNKMQGSLHTVSNKSHSQMPRHSMRMETIQKGTELEKVKLSLTLECNHKFRWM